MYLAERDAVAAKSLWLACACNAAVEPKEAITQDFQRDELSRIGCIAGVFLCLDKRTG